MNLFKRTLSLSYFSLITLVGCGGSGDTPPGVEPNSSAAANSVAPSSAPMAASSVASSVEVSASLAASSIVAFSSSALSSVTAPSSTAASSISSTLVGTVSSTSIQPSSAGTSTVSTPSSTAASSMSRSSTAPSSIAASSMSSGVSSSSSSSLSSSKSSSSSSSSSLSSASTTLDSDDDGVKDAFDNCKVTAANELVDTNGCSASQLDSEQDGINNALDACDATPSGESIDAKGCGTSTETNFTARAFVEQNGLVVGEMEHTNYASGWQLTTGNLATGNAYLIWTGADSFNTPPASGGFTIKVRINNPGTYRFMWRNIVGEGTSPTDANDSWLRIEADNFYGLRSSDSHIVCPVNKLAGNSCVGDAPEGKSAQGYFKVYRGGNPVNSWKWVTATNDNSAHAIYAVFTTQGTYNILVNPRSRGHGIDRFVLFRDLNALNNVSEASASDVTQAESARN